MLSSHACLQCYNSSDQGKALIGQYHLEQLPACIIVDPITRAKLWERYGFIGAEALVEELVPYLDCGEYWAPLCLLLMRHTQGLCSPI
jgi:hypothetical protein